MPAGIQDQDGNWTEGSVFDRCRERLEEMARLLRNAGKQEESAEDAESSEEIKEDEAPQVPKGEAQQPL